MKRLACAAIGALILTASWGPTEAQQAKQKSPAASTATAVQPTKPNKTIQTPKTVYAPTTLWPHKSITVPTLPGSGSLPVPACPPGQTFSGVSKTCVPVPKINVH